MSTTNRSPAGLDSVKNGWEDSVGETDPQSSIGCNLFGNRAFRIQEPAPLMSILEFRINAFAQKRFVIQFEIRIIQKPRDANSVFDSARVEHSLLQIGISASGYRP